MSIHTRVPTTMRRHPRSAPLAVFALVLSLVLSACGGASGSGESPGSASGADQSTSDSAFPVTIKHRYGSTTITEQPKRVVTLGLSDQDAVLALGIKPVGAVDWFKERPYGKWPWTNDKWGKDRPAIVGVRDKYDIEKIAALNPDVIIAQYSGMQKAQYEKLSKIAPVVAQPPKYPPYAAPWKVMSKRIGKALGKLDEMNKLIKQIEARFAKVREQHPKWGQQTMVVADSFEPGVYSAFLNTDPKAIFFHELGFKYPKKINELGEKGKNVLKVSAERLGLFDADRLVWLTSSAKANKRIKAEPLYQRLDVVKRGDAQFIPYKKPGYVGAAISFNTVLSIPYAMDKVVPMLQRNSGE